MRKLERQLTLKDGIFLSIGSIMGSGVLFLPSLIYSNVGYNVLYVWLIATLLCFPLLYIFVDMIGVIPNGSGIQGFVSFGLGHRMGAAIPLLFLGTVCLGMPASALIVGEYVRFFFHAGSEFQYLTAIVIIVLGTVSNILGIRSSSYVQIIISLMLLAVGIVIFLLTYKLSSESLKMFKLPSNIWALLPGIVVAFWAYAGFENLTFMAGEFKHPQRDLKRSMIIALVVCGLLYILLSLSFTYAIPQNKVNPLVGLYQLAEVSGRGIVYTFIVTFFAFLSVQVNFNSWIWGISRLIYSSSKQKILPSFFSELNMRSIPVRAVFLLSIAFIAMVSLFMVFPGFLKLAIYMVSTNFICIYLICIFSYMRFKKSLITSIFSCAVGGGLCFALISSGWLLLYPAMIVLFAYLFYKNADNLKECTENA